MTLGSEHYILITEWKKLSKANNFYFKANEMNNIAELEDELGDYMDELEQLLLPPLSYLSSKIIYAIITELFWF